MYYPIIDTVHKGIEDVFGDDDDDDKAETRPIHRLKRLDMEDEEDTRPLQTDMNPEQVRNYCYKIICAGSHYFITNSRVPCSCPLLTQYPSAQRVHGEDDEADQQEESRGGEAAGGSGVQASQQRLARTDRCQSLPQRSYE